MGILWYFLEFFNQYGYKLEKLFKMRYIAFWKWIIMQMPKKLLRKQ